MDVDGELVRRLESTAAAASVDLVDAIKRIDHTSSAVATQFAGGALVAMGRGRYVNRAIGVSMDELSASDLDEIEQFFIKRLLPPTLELSSWAPTATLAELGNRNYCSRWFRSVFALIPREIEVEPEPDLRIESVGDHDEARWLDVFTRGFEAEQGEVRRANDEIGRASRIVPNSHTFLASLGDEPAGCGSLQIVDGVAWLGGAATVPTYRRRGVQAALVAHRLRLAVEHGCELAAVSALSTGSSARNIVRLGFQHIHTQVVVERQVVTS